MIPEEKIAKYLDMLLTKSDPGDAVHTLLTVAAPKDTEGPFGFPDEEQQKVNIYAIVYVEDETTDTPEQFIDRAILQAHAEHQGHDEVLLFMALSQEIFGVTTNDDLAKQLHQEGRLHEHPDAHEATLVYAVCRDGRRWRGDRFLTGPKAGTTIGPAQLTGPVNPQMEGIGNYGYLMRRMVGIG